MEHDLIDLYLRRHINRLETEVSRHKKELEKAQEQLQPYLDFHHNKYTKSYVIFLSDTEKLNLAQESWCKQNLGYKPICMFVEKHEDREYDRDRKRLMVALFKSDEDLTAYKLKFDE